MISADGNVGIGTTSPHSFLDVAGGVAIGSYAGNNIAPMNGLIVSGNVGIGDTSPASLLTVGSGDLFQVDFSGNLVKINNVTYSWPSSQGAASTVLTNNGSGTLSWGTLGASSITADTLDFTEFQDTLDLDANLTLNQTAYTWSQTYTGTAGAGFTYTASGAVASGNAAALDINVSNASTSVPAMMLTNAGSGLALRVNDDGTATDSTPFVIDASGNVGVGTAAPTTSFELYSSAAADNIFTLTSATTANDPLIKFRTGITPAIQFSLGVDTSDANTFKIATGSGLGTSDQLTITSAGVTTIANLQLGTQSFETNAGAVTWIDLPVTSAATAGTAESYSALVDSNSLLTIYAESDGSGGIQNPRVDISHSTTRTTADTEYGLRNIFSDTGIVTTGTDTSYGSYLSVTRTGATGGTVNTYGNYITATADAAGAGTSTLYGQYVTVSGADTNYSGIFMGGKFGIGTATPTALLHLGGSAGTVGFELNSNETTNTNNVLMLRSDVASADDAVFRVQANGAVFADGAYTGTGADYAEYFSTDDTDLQPGETVCIDPTKENAVKRCLRDGDNDAIGIVSTRPSIVGNGADNRENDPHYKVIGMLGQVPGKVTGAVRVGDALTPALIPGVLRRAEVGETTVGVAMQNSDRERATIQVLISRRNKSLTVERVESAVTERIAQMNVEDQVNQFIASAVETLSADTGNLSARVAALEFAVDGYLQSSGTLSTGDTDSRLTALESDMGTARSSIETLSTTQETLLGFYSALSLDRVVLTDESGDLDLGTGTLKVGLLETGALTVTPPADPTAPTIGHATLYPVAIDADNDGMDDPTGLSMADERVISRDGRTIVIPTGAANAKSRIFVTPRVAIGEPLAVTAIHDGSDFVVSVRTPTPEPVDFDWFIVEEK